MIEKVLMIPYKIKNGRVLYFIGQRPNGGIKQPPTGHVEKEDENLTKSVIRELKEELGIDSFRNIINLKESFNFETKDGRKYRENVFAIEIGNEPIKLEERECISYKFLPLNEALNHLKFENHKKFLKKTEKIVRNEDYPRIYIIAGPGGSGKGTILSEITHKFPALAANVPTATTRQRREGEPADSKIFMNESEFEKAFKEGRMIEKNFFKGHWYGTLKQEIYNILGSGKNVITEVDLNGVKTFKEKFSNVTAIFIDVKCDELKDRLIKRGTDTNQEIEKRMKITEWELQNKRICDYIVLNEQGKLAVAVDEVAKIIKGKRKMKNPATVIIFIALVGLVLGGILITSPTKTQAPASTDSSTSAVKADTSLIYRDGGPRIGPDNAKVKIAVFSDYLCPYCKNTHEAIKSILNAQPNDVAFYPRNFVVHPQAEIMAKASEAAWLQGKFAEADDAIFEKYQTADEATMEQMAQEIGLNLDKFKSDIASQAVSDAVSKDNNNATAMNLGGTPSIFVNGQYLENPALLEETVNNLLK